MSETHTYVIRNDRMVERKDGEIVQTGGDRYALYISEAEISKEDFQELLDSEISEQDVEKILTIKFGTAVKLSGSIILKRGTPFDNVTVYSEDNGETKLDEQDQTLYKKLTNLITDSNTLAKQLFEIQQQLMEKQEEIQIIQTELEPSLGKKENKTMHLCKRK